MTKLIKYIANKVREFMNDYSVNYDDACEKLSFDSDKNITANSRILDVVYNKAAYKNEVADLQETKTEDNGDYKFEALMAIKRAYKYPRF